MTNRPAREAWVDLLDPRGDVIHTSPAVLSWDGERWLNDGGITFGPLRDPQGGPMIQATRLRITFADGEQRTVDL